MAKLSGVADVRNTLRGSNELNTIIGGNLADRLYGNVDTDIIIGGSGNDYIYAGNGENDLRGEAGNDTIIGGTDDDTYTVATGEGNDVIYDRGSSTDRLDATFLTSATSGVFIKKGKDLIIAEGTVNNLSTEITNVQGLGTLAARRAGMRSIVNGLTNSVTIKNYFGNGEVETINSSSGAVTDQTIMTNLVDYNTGLKYFNQAVDNPNIVRGTDAADHIIASANGQILRGGKGEDYYCINAKTDVVIEDYAGDQDQIIFVDNDGGGAPAEGTYVYTKEGNNLRITFDDGLAVGVDASVIIKNYYSRNGAQIERIGCDIDEVVGGEAIDVYNTNQTRDKVAALTSATKVVRGTIIEDRFDLVDGQTAYGFAGNDVYTVTAGKVKIVDSADGVYYGDTLNADHLEGETEGVFIKRGNDLIILDGGDAVDGYVDADTAVADLTNLNGAQRRVVMNNLLNMSDSITIRNYFGNGEIETIYAADNDAVTDQEIITNAINYGTGLLAFNQHAVTAKRVNGTNAADYIIANVDGQKLHAGKGDDAYVIAGGLTDVEIYDISGSDKVIFSDANFGGADSYSIEQEGNDLRISVTDAGDGDASVLIKNWALNDKYTIEYLIDSTAATTQMSNVLYGTAGNDTITATMSKSNVYPGAGDDLVYGGGNGDTLYGGDGDDTIVAGGLVDFLQGEEGSDVYEINSGESGHAIMESDADATPDTDKIVFKGADFSSSSSAITITNTGGSLSVVVNEGNSISSDVTAVMHYSAANRELELIEDGQGNVYDLSTSALAGTFNCDFTIVGNVASADTITAPDIDTTIQGNDGNDNLTGGTGNDTIEGGDGADVINGSDGNDLIIGGDGNDALLRGGDGDDTIQGGPGNDSIQPMDAGNDVILYDLDAGDDGDDLLAGLDIGEDVIRFTTSATGPMALNYRNQIAIWSASDAAASDLQIGYGWDEATQAYANTITIFNYDGTSETDAIVIEFVTGDTTYTLTDTEIEALLDEIVTNDNSADLAAVHDDGIDGAGQQLQMIVSAW